MAESTHKVEIVRVGPIQQHPNADTLGTVTIHDSYTVVVKLDQWAEGTLAAYVPPDSMVPVNRPEFAFLAGSTGAEHVRVKVKRLRGIYSQGLLIPLPEEAPERTLGADIAGWLGVTHYDSPETFSSGGDSERAMSGDRPVYDVESFRRYGRDVFPDPLEAVAVTEKVHGANARYTFQDGRLWCGSRTQWKRDDPKSIWWTAARKYPQIEQMLREHPGVTLYGEVFGQVQDLKYGRTGVDFVAFDVLDPSGSYYSMQAFMDLCDAAQIPRCPVLYTGPVGRVDLLALAEGPSQIAGAKNVREGCVVRAMQERWTPEHGRASLKIVGNGYLERA